MKKFLISMVVIVVLTQVGLLVVPTSQAPKGAEQNLTSEVQPAKKVKKLDSLRKPTYQVTQDSDTKTLLSLLEQYVEEKRDLPAAQQLINDTARTERNQHMLDLYQAKILSRSLDFSKAEQLMEYTDDAELSILKAVVLIAQNDRDRAGAYLHQLVEEHPDPDVKLISLAFLNIYHTYDKHRDAEESYLWTLFAQKCTELGEYEISQYLTDKALERNGQYRDAWLIQGYNHLQLSNYDRAETSLLTAYKLDPGNSQIQYLLGLTYFELGNPDLSTEYLLYARQNQSKYELVILEKLAENAKRMEDYALSAHYYELLLDLDPDHKAALSQLAYLYAEFLQQFQEATNYANALVIAYPEDSDSYQLLSWVLGKQEKFEQALMNAKKANQLTP